MSNSEDKKKSNVAEDVIDVIGDVVVAVAGSLGDVAAGTGDILGDVVGGIIDGL